MRLRKTKSPCGVCGLRTELCLCAEIAPLELSTRLSLVIHAKELKRTTNSGRLAVAALKNAEMYVRGQGREKLDLSALAATHTYHPVLFYPTDDAVELSSAWLAEVDKPIHLIVPDGNWRQASKVHVRHPELSSLPRVKISVVNPAAHHLRREHFAEGMSTLEAIARAIEVLEGPEAAGPLFDLYRRKLGATLLGRGIKTSLLPSEDLRIF